MNPNTRTIVHLSDLHFGRDDPHVVAGLRDAVIALSPDVLAVSGDLTQRARRTEFQRARAFLDTLPFPRIVVPGNHDVPLFNLAARVFDPLGGYTRHITGDLEPCFADDVVWMAGVDTTRPERWKSGRIRQITRDRLHELLTRAVPDSVKVLVAHHPFEVPEGNAGATDTLSALTGAGIDVVLTGHLHASYTGHTAHRYRIAGRSAVVVEAGTASSTRVREESNAFNVLRVARDRIEVEQRQWDGRAFGPSDTQQFTHSESGWIGA
jgi:3',5'-cyclic AMP phosphodiesterase CpdA